MTVKMILIDDQTDGAIPVNGNISMTEQDRYVRIAMEGFTLLVPLDGLEDVIYDDLHG